MENKIILVGGYCATGKSTFSHKLSKLLNIPVFNKDTIKEVLGNGFGPENNIVEKKGSTVTFLLMLHITECMLKTNKCCLLESNFRAKEIEQIKLLLEKYNYKCLTFIFKGEFNILFNRYIERDASESRHWVHNNAGDNREDFESGHLQEGIGETGIGQIIIKDTTLFSNINYDELFDIAKEFMEDIN